MYEGLWALEKAGMVRGIQGHLCGSRGRGSLPLASRSAPLLVILNRDRKEDQQGDALDPRQEEEVVVQRAVVDITWKDRGGTLMRQNMKHLRGETGA